MRVVLRMGREREDRLRVDRHPRLGARAGEVREQLVVVEDDPVVDPDDRAVPDGMVVGGDRRMALRVVAHVDEQLGRVGGNTNALEQVARRRPLLRHDRIGVTGAAVRVPDRVRATLGDPCEQRLRRQRPIDAATRGEAVTGYSTHKPWPMSSYRLRRLSGRPFESTRRSSAITTTQDERFTSR